MFIENFEFSPTEIEGLLKFILFKASKINYLCKKNNQPVEMFAKSLNLKSTDRLFAYNTLAFKKIGQTIAIGLHGNLISPNFLGYAPFEEANTFIISDFDIKIKKVDNIYPIIYREHEIVENAFFNYMYKKFGEPYKNAYIQHRAQQLQNLTTDHNIITDQILQEMVK